MRRQLAALARRMKMQTRLDANAVSSSASETTQSYAPILERMSQHLHSMLNRPLHALEWGPGLNTEILAIVADRIVTIESNRSWWQRYAGRFSSFPQVELIFLPFPDDPNGIKRYPGEQDSDGNVYIAHPEYYDPQCDYVTWPATHFKPGTLDIAFIDGGGYRRDCMRVARTLLASHGICVLHDYPRTKVQRDMPTGNTYQDAVEEFSYIRVFADARTTVMSNSADWFLIL